MVKEAMCFKDKVLYTYEILNLLSSNNERTY